jgi:hypothetical protein
MVSAIWVVSYPRSGNTYVRALLANYFSGLDRPLTLNEISLSTWGEHIEGLWQTVCIKPAEERTLEAQWLGRPSYFKAVRALATPDRRLIKSHTINAQLQGQPAFVFEPADRIIHVVRHPCDVAISVAHFHNTSIDAAVDRLLTSAYCVGNDPLHTFEVLGSWNEHTNCWLQALPAPVHRVRYFELVDEPASTLGNLLRFIGVEPEPERVEQTLRFASFGELKAQEEQNGFIEGSKIPGADKFFRVGKALQWWNQLTEDQSRRLIEANSALLDELGFTAYAKAARAA